MGYVRKIPCAKVGCLNFAEKGSMYCSEHIPPKQYNRDNTSKYKYMYNSEVPHPGYHIPSHLCLQASVAQASLSVRKVNRPEVR